MAVSAQLVNELRKKTDAGVMECKKALEEANGDLAKAEDILRLRGQKKAEAKSEREIKEGTICSYVHAGAKIGVLLELGCETDFVARNQTFQDLARDIAMQIAAMKPRWATKEQVPQDVLDKELALFKEDAAKSGKPDALIEKIVQGRLEKWYAEFCLVEQPYIKEDKLKIRELIQNTVAKLGENISIRRFMRFQIGEGQE
ncbi:MAG: translation elongation factor Ts [Candidatus Riflebacteria bacterium]|nr:translation elongation factor Ts [Candidatus Riflebacteria bacterium]